MPRILGVDAARSDASTGLAAVSTGVSRLRRTVSVSGLGGFVLFQRPLDDGRHGLPFARAGCPLSDERHQDLI